MLKSPERSLPLGLIWIEKNALWILPLSTIFILFPLVSTAFRIDEPLFLWVAKHILKEPGNPFNFSVNWYGTAKPMWEIIQNPPLTSYLLAAIGCLVGFGESTLHTAFLLFAVAFVLGTYLLARRFCSHAWLAGFCALAAPSTLVCSGTVMSDTLMGALWCMACVFWLRGLENRKWQSLLLASFLIGLTGLTKYFGIALIPLLFAYTWVKDRRLGPLTLYLIIPVAMLWLWHEGSLHLYGRSHLVGAGVYSISRYTAGPSSGRFLQALSFLGGATLFPILMFPFVRAWRGAVLFAGLLATSLLVSLFLPYPVFNFLQQPNTIQIIVLSIFLTGGLLILVHAIRELCIHRNSASVFLSLWILGGFVFIAFINWTVAVRNILPLVPAISILTVRVTNERKPFLTTRWCLWTVVLPLLLSIGVGTWVASTDLRWAGSQKEAAEIVCRQFTDGKGKILFQGHWGFQYYMEALGAEALDFQKGILTVHDVMVVPLNNTNVIVPKDKSCLIKVGAFEMLPGRWFATMNRHMGAGLHSNIWGPLPYAWGHVQPDRYLIYILRKN